MIEAKQSSTDLQYKADNFIEREQIVADEGFDSRKLVVKDTKNINE